MLVLSRKVQEGIQVGENIVITVLKVKGNMVRIGIDAPSHVRVKRFELPDRQIETETEREDNSAPLARFVRKQE